MSDNVRFSAINFPAVIFKIKIYKNEEIVYTNNHQHNKKILIIIEGNLVNVRFDKIV